MPEFMKAEARAIKRLLNDAIANDRPTIFAGIGWGTTQAVLMAQAKIISAAAGKLDEEWDA